MQNLEYLQDKIYSFKKAMRSPQSHLDSLLVGYHSLDYKNATYRHFLANKGLFIQEVCLHCGKQLDFNTIKKKASRANQQGLKGEIPIFCSVKCSANSESTKDKFKQTNLQKYGVENPSSSVKIRQKVKKVMLTKYGNENPFLTNNFKEKAKQTCIEKYGVENISLLGRGKFEDSKEMKINYSVLEDFDRHVNQEISRDYFLDTLEKSGLSLSVLYKRMRSLNITFDRQYTNVSYPETKIQKFLQELGVDFIANDRKTIAPYELDILIPSHNLAIEFNGLYWHSSSSVLTDKEYKYKHLNKTKLCQEKGILLLHIFENEWRDNEELWKSVIKQKLGLNTRIYARQCVKQEVDSKTAKEFLAENHLQGACNSSRQLGLYYQGELVMLATFGKPRYTKGSEWELLRLCTKKGLTVVGGASKLLKGFDSLVSYANKRWSDGNLYKQLGFELVGESDPCYWYHKYDKLEHRSKYQRHKLQGEGTEVEIMYRNGYARIWDCGNYVYRKTNNSF